MTRPEARKIAKQMVRAGYRPVIICEDLTAREGMIGVYIDSMNRAGCRRTIETPFDWDSIKPSTMNA